MKNAVSKTTLNAIKRRFVALTALREAGGVPLPKVSTVSDSIDRSSEQSNLRKWLYRLNMLALMLVTKMLIPG